MTITVDGTTAVKALFKQKIFSQELIFENGWNWISTYLNEPVQMDVILGGVTRLLSQTGEIYNDSDLGTDGNIENLQPGKAYKVQASYLTMKKLKGRMYNSDTNPMSVKRGWNWISYPYLDKKDVNDVIGNAEEGEFLVAQNGFAEYSEGKWHGTLTEMEAGAGYLYKPVNDKTVVFGNSAININAIARTISVDALGNNTEADVDMRKYPNTMNIILDVTQGGVSLGSEYTVYAYIDNECRGISKFVDGKCYMTVYGEEEEPVEFVVKKADNGEILQINESILFHEDVIGHVKDPYKMTVFNPTGINGIYVNGTNTLYNTLGQKVKKAANKGIYIYNKKKVVIDRISKTDAQ